ncbi:MAG: hypothetical protein IJF45_02540 [Clostridia bacterium]|nr:hypothetical protein [Clostridia bacterium]
MIGNLIGTAALIFLGSFVIGTMISIAKELLSRRKAAANEQNTESEKESDQSNSANP